MILATLRAGTAARQRILNPLQAKRKEDLVARLWGVESLVVQQRVLRPGTAEALVSKGIAAIKGSRGGDFFDDLLILHKCEPKA